jgi:hypothetical protein
MYCPRCGKPEQVAETYCRNCGVFLFDASKPAETTEWWGDNIDIPTFVNALRAAVCFVFAILLYAVAGSQPDASRLIPITAVILFAMGVVQSDALRKTIRLRKRRKSHNLAEHNDAITGKLLEPPNFADLAPDSVITPTTRQLTREPRRR